MARKTASKMLEYAAPPGYQRRNPVRRPKLGPWQGTIEAILEEEKHRPRKQRHTAKRIFERLRAEHGYTGGYTIVKDNVRAAARWQGDVHPADSRAGRGAGRLQRSPGK